MNAVPMLSLESEERIRKGLQQMTSEVEQGSSPTEALAKVAKELDLPRGHLPILARCFNIGSMEFHRKSHDSLQEKVAAIDLASYEDAEKILYPSEKKAAIQTISSDYRRPVKSPSQTYRTEKVARLLLERSKITKEAKATEDQEDPPLAVLFDTRRSLDETIKNAHSVLRREWSKFSVASEQFMKSVKEANLCPIALQETVELANGDLGLGFLEHLINQDPDYKAIKEASTGKRGLSWPINDPRMSSFYDAIKYLKQANDYAQMAQELEQKRTQLQAEIDRMIGDIEPHPEEKVATFIAHALGTATGSALGREIKSKLPGNKERQDLEDDVYEELTDPEHLQELRSAEISAMLNEFLTDDEVISGYPQDDVLKHFNGIAQTAPRVSGQKEIVRGLLRKGLAQGALDPFESKMLLDIENGLKRREESAGSGKSLEE